LKRHLSRCFFAFVGLPSAKSDFINPGNSIFSRNIGLLMSLKILLLTEKSLLLSMIGSN